MGYASLKFRGQSVIVVKPIEANEFDSLESFKKKAEEQGVMDIIVTQEAWNKYESMLFPPEELQKFTSKEDK